MSAKKENNNPVSEATHTPTPWAWDKDDLGVWINLDLQEIPLAVAKMCDQSSKLNPEANAAFIVRAVNNHEELVDLLRYLSCSFEPDSHQALFIKKAIARAEGKGE